MGWYEGSEIGVLGLNVLWFGMAFRFFTLTPERAAKILVARAEREQPLMPTLAASLRFLGGMNLALAVFAALLLANRSLFPSREAWGLFAAVFAIGHGSQFYCNIPILRQGRHSGKPLWSVLKGPMRLIFIVDGSLFVANTVLFVLAYCL